MKLIYILIGIFSASQSLATVQDSQSELLASIQHDIDFYQSHLYENKPHRLSEGLIDKLYNLNGVLSQVRAEKELTQVLIQPLKEAHADIQSIIGQIDPEFEIRVTQVTQLFVTSGTDTGTIRGQVINSAQGTTLNGASVYLYSTDGSYLAGTNTDSIGRYFFSDINVGNYLVSGQKNGYGTQFYDGVPCSGGLGLGCSLNEVNLISVEANQTTSHIDFDLINNGKIVGRLIDQENNEGVSGRIRVYDENQVYINSYNASYNTGEFNIALESGSYYLEFSEYGYISELYNNKRCLQECDFSQAELIEVSLGSEATLGNISLLKYRAFGGQVLDLASGDPLFVDNSSQRVEVVDADTGYVQGATNYNDINNEGEWHINGIAPGSYKVRSKVPGYLAQYNTLRNCSGTEFSQCDDSLARVYDHQNISATLNVNFRHKLGGKISGRVYHVGSNGNISATVTLYDHNGNQVAITNSSGESYSFSGLANGNYYVSARLRYSDNAYLPTLRPSTYCQLNDGSLACLNPTDGTVISVTNYGHSQNNNIRLKSAAKITGVIKDASNNPIESANVKLWFKSNYPNNYRVASVYTNQDGRYTFNNLTLSDYYITASNSEYVTEIYNNRTCPDEPCDATYATDITASNGQTYGDYNFDLAKKARISFSLSTPTNIEIDGRLNIYTNNGQYIGYYNVYQGNSEFNLSAGSYRFIYSANRMADKVFGGSNCFDDCDPMSGSQVTVSNNGFYQYSMQVDALFRIYGEVDGPDSNYSRVKLYRNNQDFQSVTVYGNSYEIYVRTPGQVKVGISEDRYYSNFYYNVECETLSCALSQANPLATSLNGGKKIDFVLKPLIQISGRVADQQGDPISGIEVQLRTENNYIGYAYTDQNGEYDMQVQQAGTYYLITGSNSTYVNTLLGDLACEDMACDITTGTPINVVVGDNLAGMDIIPRKKGTVNINQVKYIDGTTADNIKVDIFDSVSLYRVTSKYTDDAGNIPEFHLPTGSYMLRANSQSTYNSYYTVYPNISCAGLGTESCITMGNPIEVSLNTASDVEGFQVHKHGNLNFNVTSEDTNEPVPGATVILYDQDFEFISSEYTSSAGVAEFFNLSEDKVYAFIEPNQSSRFRSSLYDGITCDRGLGIDCLFTSGSLIELTDNTTTQIGIELTSKPSIVVKAIDAITLAPVAATFRVYSLVGNLISSSSQHESEHIIYLNEGEYYLLMENSYYNSRYAPTAYPDTRCTGSYLVDCPNAYSSIQVTASNMGSFTTAMEIETGISGFVVDRSTGDAMENVILDFWRISNFPYHYGSTVTEDNGGFSMVLNDNDYYISTDLDTADGYYNQVYSNIFCVEGPAILDQCDLTLGTAVSVEDEQVSNILLQLAKDPIFENGFN